MGCMMCVEPCHHTALAGVGDKPGRHRSATRTSVKARRTPATCRWRAVEDERTTIVVKERSPSDQTIVRAHAHERAVVLLVGCWLRW
jgi:hypothetical protein